MRPAAGPARGKTSVRLTGPNGEPASSSQQVAHTLTACTRCRTRKTRCDPGLPRCGPCERTNSQCAYYDAAKGRTVNRSYVIYLQHRVRELEEELERVENEDSGEDPEAMMRAADVRVHEAKDSKYLGPASGIATTRLVMQLAKQFTDATSIKEIVSEQRAWQIKELYHQEQAKPTSKIYPLISDVAADQLPNRPLTDLLVQLYKLKVQPLYPALHEPTLDADVEAVYSNPDHATIHQHFVCRMVIAISLQKMDTQYAGLADSYYLAALSYLEPVVKRMDLQTLQSFALMAEYSLLTPTRTAIYYVMGIAVRLVQALGYHEEKTITRNSANPSARASALEIDMRRRLFWSIFVMDCGLAHSLGRPAMLATSHEHIDVQWFELCDDKCITAEGVDRAAAKTTLKKWIAVHFFKMRLLQLEIRRTLYLRKQATPRDDSDPWFQRMDGKIIAWRDASPSADEGHGLNKVWFVMHYNTIVVFLYRPCPQVPRPSLQAALKCFEACEYNIYIQREQMARKSVDLTWIFTQSMFMAINTMLWSLSYEEVRRKHSRVAVEKHLNVAMEAIQLASERWPGVASAVQLYQNLIGAILKVYDKDGDVPISAATPSDAASPGAAFPDNLNRSTAASPGTASTQSIPTPPQTDAAAPFGYFHQQSRRSVEQPPPMPYRDESQPPQASPPPAHTSPAATATMQTSSMESVQSVQAMRQPPAPPPALQDTSLGFDPYNHFNPLPEFTPELTVPGWSAPPGAPMPYAVATDMPVHNGYNGFSHQGFALNHPQYQQFNGGTAGADMQYEPQFWDMDSGSFGAGLNQAQQEELMQSLETEGMEDIQTQVDVFAALWATGMLETQISYPTDVEY